MSTVPEVPGTGQNYWRSLQELAQSEEFRRHLETEFPGGTEPPTSAFTRRRFLQIMAASAALAGVAGCRWPEQDIVPFAERPAGMTPGKTEHFATAIDLGGAGQPLLATSFDGRPIKVDGNPEHPMSQGGAGPQIQASVLDLYDADRLRAPRRRDGQRDVGATWTEFEEFLATERKRLDAAEGRGLAILAGASSSPSQARLREQLQDRFPRARWYEHEPVDDAAARAGSARAFGRPQRGLPHLAEARVVADFDANFLVEHPASLRLARDFARRRQPRHGMNRLYVFEPGVTQTGAMADHRVPTAAVDVPVALGALAAEIFLGHGVAVPAGAGFRAADLEAWRGQGPAPEVITALAEDLTDHRGEGLVLVGDRQPAGAHHLAHVLNAALGGAGKTVTYVELEPPAADLAALAADLQAGGVRTLIVLGGDPAVTAPADVDFAAAVGKAATSLHLTERPLRTTGLCAWHLPRSHYLETWGDAVAADGSYLAVQPLIAPLYDSRSELELLALLLGSESRTGYDTVRATFHRRTGGNGDVPTGTRGFEERWRRFLHDGFLGGERPADATPPLAATAGLDLPRSPSRLDAENLELIIKADPSVHDGRFANNAWLQEMPDFTTKVAWDNVAALSPATAAALQVEQGDLLELEFRGRTTSMPAYVLPGHAAHSITVTLGYGLAEVGRVGDGVGHAVYPLRTRGALHGGTGLKVRRTGRTYPLACAQDHHAIDPKGYAERESRVGSLVREGTLEHYLENAEFVDHLGLHHPPLKSLWQEKDYTGYKWGMSIDLNSCIGCNACVLACQAENNIPVVGKEEIGYSREMHWIRVDRYFKGDPENPDIAAQPVTCAQCEMAPCESVCPVGATMHTEEGLNAMVYNRCVGTRYCANNCPYKVRRFNFFNNIDHLTDTAKMQLNPDVTVRSRGVMEKCTYCVQRIQHAKITAKREGRSVRDGEIVPACAQTCPTEAIVFGDLNDPGSRVSQQRADSRSYDMLAFLNIKPRTSYMARIRNPHPKLAPAGHGHESHGGENHGGESH